MAYNKETGMYEGYIYKIYNDVNDKVYIGQTITNIDKRYRTHISNSQKDNCIVIDKAINKYGKDHFNCDEVVRVQNNNENILKYELDELERFYINLYDSISTGYNIDAGGKSSTSFKKKVYKYNKDGELLYIYNSITEAANLMNGSESSIASVCKGINITAYDFIWRFEGDDFYKYATSIKNNQNRTLDDKIKLGMLTGRFKGKTVNCYTLDGIFVKSYISLSDAANDVGLANGYNITNVCKGKRNCAGGYKWFYANDESQPDKTKIIKAS